MRGSLVRRFATATAIATAAVLSATLLMPGAAAADPPPTADLTPAAADPPDLAGDIAPDPNSDLAQAQALGDGRRWPGRTITYYSNLRGNLATAADLGAANWNAARIGITFRKVRSRGTADVIVDRITARNSRCGVGAAGCATLGYAKGMQSRLSLITRTNNVPDSTLQTWAFITTHELGHVLGLGHSGNADDLMAPTGNGQPKQVRPDGRCRYYAANDLRRAKRMYGGPGRLTPTRSCLMLPAPEPVTGLQATLTGYSVNTTWRPGADSYVISRSAAGGACPTDPAREPAGGMRYPIDAAKFPDSQVQRVGVTYCYTVFPMSRDGLLLGSRAASLRVAIPAGPMPPANTSATVEFPGYGAWGIRATAPDSSFGSVRVAAAFGSCPDPDTADYRYWAPALITVYDGDAAAGDRVCLRFWDESTWYGKTRRSSFVDTWVTLPPQPQ